MAEHFPSAAKPSRSAQAPAVIEPRFSYASEARICSRRFTRSRSRTRTTASAPLGA